MLLHPSRLARRIAGGLLAASLFLAPENLRAQASPPPGHWELFALRSGVHENPHPVEGVVWRGFVNMPAGTPWLRLYFSSVWLDKGSLLRIVSLRDGDVMTMRQEHMAQWGYSSAFFNGDAVMVEIVAGPNTGKNFVEIDKVWAGDINPVAQDPESICGSNDERTPFTDIRVGRIDPVGCTGWIIDFPAASTDKVHLSAGHCSSSGVLEFAVPGSASNCGLVHPPASRQFAIDLAGSQSVNGGTGNDWWVFRCFPNSTTGLTTYQTQGGAFALAGAMPALSTVVRVTGYGLDGSDAANAGGANTNCTCTPGNGTGTRNQTSQTHTGPLTSTAGSTLRYQVDTCGGNSGSPVIDTTTNEAIGIHTHGGCGNPTGTSANAGTEITLAALQTAIATVGSGAGGTVLNDVCSAATPIVNGVNGTFSNAGATTSGNTFLCGSSVARDVWFSYVATCSGSTTFSTCSANRTADTVLEVYTTCSGTALICNDDSCGFGSSVTVATTVGIRYLVRVGGYGGSMGSFDVVVTSCDVADECASAIPLQYGDNGPFTNNGSTTSAPAWPCVSGGNDVWGVYAAPPATTVTFTTCVAGTNYDTVLEVFRGSCGSLASIACNDDMGIGACSLNSFRSRVSATTTTAELLYVRIGGYLGRTGTFELNVSHTPVNDDCASAIPVTNGTNGPFANLGGANSTPFPCGGTAAGRDVWFSYVASCTGNLLLTTCTPSRTFDTVLEVFGGSCGSLTSLGCNDDTPGTCGLGSTMSVPVSSGLTYYIRLGGYSGAQGYAELDVACALANDECANAIALVDGTNGPFTNVGATVSPPNWPCGTATNVNDVWFAYSAGYTGPHTFTTCTLTRSFDTMLQVFDGCATLGSVGCNDDIGGSCGLGSRLTVNLSQGVSYRVRVGGFNGATGNFDLVAEPGTGTGSIVRVPHGCGPTTITCTGQPRMGGTINTSLGNLAGAPFIGLGLSIGSTPFCGICTIGHDWAAPNLALNYSLYIPPNPAYIGIQVGIQGADFLGTGGCPAPAVTLTDTFVITIG